MSDLFKVLSGEALKQSLAQQQQSKPATTAIGNKQPVAQQIPQEPPKPKLTHAERVAKYREAVEEPRINMHRIRELSHQGVPDELRSIYWKILLGYLPCDKSRWSEELDRSRKLYSQWHMDLIVNPRKEFEKEQEEKEKKAEEDEDPELQEITQGDHPLAQHKGSEWNEYFKDSDMIYEIEKDVSRTFPHLHFFQQQTTAVITPSNLVLNKLHAKTRLTTAETPLTTNIHYQALRSILFMWAKLNPGIAYVQGMNEIIGPIYYIFATDADHSWQEHAEADAFFCFTNIMSEIMNNFCKTLDTSQVGIKGKIKELNMLLRQKDPELWLHMENLQLDPQFYSFRWLTLLLSQEFELPDVMRLWDSLFSDKHRFKHLLNVCVAMLVYVIFPDHPTSLATPRPIPLILNTCRYSFLTLRRIKRVDLLSWDFANCLKTLQKYPSVDINTLLALADDISADNYKATEFLLPMDAIEEELTAEASPVMSVINNAWNSAWNSLMKF